MSTEQKINEKPEQSSEDILKMASLAKIEQSYFETSLKSLLFQRGGILAILLLIQ